MDNNIKFEFTDKELAQFEVEMMNMIYETLIINVDAAIDNNANREDKISALNTVLNYFEKKEEYEKCTKIKEIITHI